MAITDGGPTMTMPVAPTGMMGGGFGGENGWWVILFIILLFGWGRNGYGNNSGGVMDGYVLTSDFASSRASCSGDILRRIETISSSSALKLSTNFSRASFLYISSATLHRDLNSGVSSHPARYAEDTPRTLAIFSRLSKGMLVIIPVSYLYIVCLVAPNDFPKSSCDIPFASRAALIRSPIVFCIIFTTFE